MHRTTKAAFVDFSLYCPGTLKLKHLTKVVPKIMKMEKWKMSVIKKQNYEVSNF